MRKAWFPAVLVATLVFITIAYIRLVIIMSENRKVYDALPETASIIFEFNAPKATLEKLAASAFNADLSEAPFFKKLAAQISSIDSFVKTSTTDTAFSTWDNSLLLASMNITGRDEFDYLYVLKKKNFTKDKFQKFITAESRSAVGKRQFRDETIYDVPVSGMKSNLACAFVNGLLIASYVPSLVEQSVAQLRDNKSLLDDKGFAEVNELAGKDADVVLYLDLAGIGQYEPLMVNEEQATIFKAAGQLGNWMELDIKVKDNSFMINGYTGTDAKKPLLAGFTREPSTQVEIIRVVPYNTALFFYYAVNDFETYMKDKGKTLTPEMENFHNWISNEWCFGLLEPMNTNYENDVFIAIRAVDPEIAAQSLAELARLSGDVITLEEFREYPIGRLSLKDDLNNLFDHHFLKVAHPYYTVIDDFAVFANDLSVIKTVLQNYEDGQTLRTDPDYMAFEQNLTTTSNFYIYFNTSRSLEFLNRILSNALASDIRKGNKDFLKFSPVALQFNHYQDIFFTNGYIQFAAQATEHSNRLWQVKLDGVPTGSPAFVTNHYTGEEEILIQDSQDNIYLITKNGRILWKRKIDGQNMSEIYLVDYFENNKFQYAFNTQGKIYILDRKGNDVATYPVSLPAKATNGMLLVDYDRNKDYRMFVACANGNIYGFYKSGKQLPGWNPKPKAGNIKIPLKFIAVGGKDYLIAENDEGTIFLYNRKGDLRSKPVRLDKSFGTDFQLRPAKNNFQLLNADKDGNIYKIYHNGSHSSQKQDALPKNFFDFIYTDMNGDGKYEMVFVDSLVAKIYDEKFAEIASPSFSEKIDKAFLFQDGKKSGIGFLSLSGKNIYCLDSSYRLNSSFELASCTPFITTDLFETGRKVAIAGDCDGWVNAYQVK